MIRKLMTAVLMTALIAISVPALAQSGEQSGEMNDMIELLRSDVQTQKKAIMTNAMAMTEAESEAFWPIYNEYQNELRKIGDARVKLIKDYAANYDTMTDEMATELVKRSLKTQEDRLNLYKKYNGKLAKALSPRMAARWLQTEHAVNTLIDVQVASQLPLME
jgi:hypothetical protein